MTPPTPPSDTVHAAVAAAVDCFAERGFDSTSVDEIAEAAGMSRSTFFRHFGGKSDVVFADHEVLLRDLEQRLAAPGTDPWTAICHASEAVFTRLTADPALAKRRFELVRSIPLLRDREIVTRARYERLFTTSLLRAAPDVDPADAVGFAALVTALHNHVLRRFLRGEPDVTVETLRATLAVAPRRMAVDAAADGPNEPRTAEPASASDHPGDVVVAVFPRSTPPEVVAQRVAAAVADTARPPGVDAEL